MKKRKDKNFIKALLEAIIKLFIIRKKEHTEDVPKDNLIDITKEEVEDLLFEIGIPNPFNSQNAIKIREIIKDEFGGGKKKWNLQCTEYVQYKIQQIGIIIQWPVKFGRDGGKWADIFEKHGPYKILDTPKSGCAVSFKEKHGLYGHIAFVEEVLDNETIKISEANFIIGKNPAGEYSERTLPKSRWQDRYKCRFIDFS